MFFHTEARALPIGPQAKACGLLDNTRQTEKTGIFPCHPQLTVV